MEKKYTIGLDYGTLSGRGVVVSCEDGRVLASAVKEYSHGIMDRVPKADGSMEQLPADWALEYPGDYIEVLEEVVPKIVKDSKVAPEDIVGIGIDFTSCTMLLVDEEGTPLCEKEEFRYERNAYAKLWKHHGAQRFADKINQYLEEKGFSAFPRFGGKVSPELLLPKVMEILKEAPKAYEAADEILETGDWLTRMLTKSHKRSCSMAGYKAWWSQSDGYPGDEFFSGLDPKLRGFVEEKLPGQVVGVGEKVGVLSEEWAKRLGLCAGIAVAPTIIDSHAGVPGSGVSTKEQVMLVLGTSSVMVGLSETPYSGEGVLGGVRDAVVPGYYALESGLASVGDLFGWFVERLTPASYMEEAKEKGIHIHALLSQKAAEVRAGSSGLLALDWWNGNKTPFVNGDLKGSILGMTLRTRPEEIYRALIEATAYGTRRILEIYEQSGIQVEEIICSGGISLKNPLLMQIYADVLGKKLKVASSDQAAALGSAVYAALAAGASAGGYDDYTEAVQSMSRVKDTVYEPDIKAHRIYTELYSVYKEYSTIMGDTNQSICKRLTEIQKE